MLKTFFKTGVVDDSRYTYSPISFEVGFGYPTIMKLVVGGAIQDIGNLYVHGFKIIHDLC